MGYFPLFYKLTSQKILLIGGGVIALSKLETLFAYSDDITVVAKEFLPETKEFLLKHKIAFLEEEFREELLSDSNIIVSATDDHVLNNQVAFKARALGKLVNVVDDVDNSDFIFPALVKRGNITIAASSSGVSPVLSRLLKQRIAKILPESFSNLDEFIKSKRAEVKARLTDLQARRLFWQEVIEGHIAEEILAGNQQKAEALFAEKLVKQNNAKQAALYLIGAGPGDPELITLKAINLLSRADIVLYDRLVASEILDYARKDALKINVGKTKNYHKCSQEEIHQLMRDYLAKGNIVARLKGGDVAIFAHLHEEIDIAKELEVPFQIVPGITAASGASAYSGIALTARNISKAVRYLSLYKEDMFNADYWQDLAKTEDSLVFYMSSTNVNLISAKLLEYGKAENTPIAVIEQATTKFQKSYISNLKNFSQEYGTREFKSPSLIIIGEVVRKNYSWREENHEGMFFPELKIEGS